MNFEKAAVIRDKIFALETTLEKQVALTTDFVDRDVIGLAKADGMSVITLLYVRGGKLVGTGDFSLEQTPDHDETFADDQEIISSFIQQYYEKHPFIPQEILTPAHLNETKLLEEWLKSVAGKKAQILFPKRGAKTSLIKTAFENAKSHLAKIMASENQKAEMLLRMQKTLRLKNAPKRIECFDNSNISGTEPVAAMAVFVLRIVTLSGTRKIPNVAKKIWKFHYMA